MRRTSPLRAARPLLCVALLGGCGGDESPAASGASTTDGASTGELDTTATVATATTATTASGGTTNSSDTTSAATATATSSESTGTSGGTGSTSATATTAAPSTATSDPSTATAATEPSSTTTTAATAGSSTTASSESDTASASASTLATASDTTTDAGTATDTDTDTGPIDRCAPFLGLEDAALRDALSASVAGHTVYSYLDARNFMYGITGTIDVFDGQIESVYTAASVAPDGTRTPGGTFNTEHSWPRSDGADVEPPLSDIHHLFPCDEPSNTERASYPFGETTCEAAACPWSDDGSELGPDGEGRTVFEVRGARRGDVARAHFYFAVRYALAIESAEESTLRAWHIEDPPDAREQARNDRIEAVQANRNPFVDCPELVDDLLDL